MGKNTNGKSEFNQMVKDRAKNGVKDLRDIYKKLQEIRKVSHGSEVSNLEEEFNQKLKDLENELNEPSPASSLHQSGSWGSLDISKLLHFGDEEDDATSGLTPPNLAPYAYDVGNNAVFYNETLEGSLNSVSISEIASLGAADNTTTRVPTELDYLSFDLPEDFRFDMLLQEDTVPQINEFSPQINEFTPLPSASFGPKCALWDCLRPAQGQPPNHCSTWHAAAAETEGQPGMKPVLRPKGIALKDDLFCDALCAKSQGKNVGIPECEGASARSPWNAPELFDMSLFEGETLREWLFFEKPRMAFKSGNKTQKSLPDYNGRWHQSGNKVINNESGCRKRSFYMDPQPEKFLEWHLYMYEINKCSCALYRLELKVFDPNKSPKGKTATDVVNDLQKQMSQLTALSPSDSKSKRSVKGRGEVNLKDRGGPSQS